MTSALDSFEVHNFSLHEKFIFNGCLHISHIIPNDFLLSKIGNQRWDTDIHIIYKQYNGLDEIYPISISGNLPDTSDNGFFDEHKNKQIGEYTLTTDEFDKFYKPIKDKIDENQWYLRKCKYINKSSVQCTNNVCDKSRTKNYCLLHWKKSEKKLSPVQ